MSSSDEEFWEEANLMIEELNSDEDHKFYLEMKRLNLQKKEGPSSKTQKQKRKYIERGREDGDARLWNDYFSPQPVFEDPFFRRRFRMRRSLFNGIVEGISNHSVYFNQRWDALGKKGLSPLQKCTCAIRQLAYGTTGDVFDEYIRIGERTATDCLHNFCRCVIEVFSNEYLRKPNQNDVQRLLERHSNVHGFPGMLGSIDCMHWAWKNCPVAWKGQYTRGDHGYPTIMLKAVASNNFWIWHAYFGVAGSNNDLNVLNQSSVFNHVLEGRAPECNFTVNGNSYTQGYYLADGIYPEWATIIKSIPHPQDEKKLMYSRKQESARKDVERAFGVLQARWAIVRGPARAWSMKVISDIMHACIILHNMIVEDEGFTVSNWSSEEIDADPITQYLQGPTNEFEEYIKRFDDMHDNSVHHLLRRDLVEHIWSNMNT